MLILVSVIYQVRLDIIYHGQAVYNIQYMFIEYIDYFHLKYIYIYISSSIHILRCKTIFNNNYYYCYPDTIQ